MTNWCSVDFDDTDFTNISGNETSMYIKLGSAWITALLYIWTLLAPRCCAERSHD